MEDVQKKNPTVWIGKRACRAQQHAEDHAKGT